MGLRQKESRYDYSGNFIESSLELFAESERRLAFKRQALQDMVNELYLLEEQAFNRYKEHIDYGVLGMQAYIDVCRKWISMQNDKIDKRKKYPEKESYDYYINTVKSYLGIDELKDIQWLNYNYGQATHIRFSYLGHRWELDIPHKEMVSFDDYKRYGTSVFRLSLHHQDINCEYSWETFGETYEEDELKDIFKKGIERYCNEKM